MLDSYGGLVSIFPCLSSSSRKARTSVHSWAAVGRQIVGRVVCERMPDADWLGERRRSVEIERA